MSTINNTTEQLMALKALTRTTGCLHEAQILQFKLWPFVLYPKIKVKYELQIDQDGKAVTYLLKFPGKVPASLPEQLKGLEEAVQWLVGAEWLLTVKVGSKRVFQGERRVESVDSAEKKAYAPFVKCVNEYVPDTGIKHEDPPASWEKQ